MISSIVPARTMRLGALAVLLSSLGVAQTAALSLGFGSGSPGSVITVDLFLAATVTQPATLEWTVNYPTKDITALNVAAGGGVSSSIECNNTAGASTCVMWNVSSNTISNGVAASLAFTISASTTDTSSAIQLSNGVAASSGGSEMTSTTTGSTLTLGSVAPPAPVITSATSANGTTGAAFSYQIAATNSPASFNATGLPTGLSVSTATGLISGTPSSPGTSTVSLSATNTGGTGHATLTLTVATGSTTGMSPSPGTTLPANSALFSWPAVSGATQYWLDVGSQLAKGDYFGAAMTATSFTVTTLPCDGRTVYVQVWAFIGGAWQTPNRYTYTAASGCSALTAPTDNSMFSSNTVTFYWGATSGADQYWLDVGNSIGKGDIYGAATTSLSTAVGNIPCDGRTIYTQLWTHISGVWQNPGRYIYTAFTGTCGNSGASGITSPAAGSLVSSPSQMFSWNPVSGADQYWLDVGSQVGQGDYFGAATTATAFTVTSMPCDGRTVYTQLWVHINGSWQPPQRATYTAVSGCAALSAPADGTVFATTAATFTWNAVSGADQYWLDVGNTIGKGDIYGAATTSLFTALTNIPCDGRTVYVQLWSYIGGAWKNPGRYEFTASGLCGRLTTPVPGSTLSGSTVTFSWTPGTGAITAYWLDVGTAVGKGDIYAANLGLGTSHTVSGIPTTGQPIYVQVWSMIGGVWNLNRYTFTAF